MSSMTGTMTDSGEGIGDDDNLVMMMMMVMMVMMVVMVMMNDRHVLKYQLKRSLHV